MVRKTVDELEKEQLAALQKATEDAHTVKKETMENSVNTYAQQVDANVEQQKSVYESSIRDAQRAEKAQLDDHYIDELVARKNLENTMADMGLTDSGLNRSQQTAITVMRGNADAKTRQNTADRVQSFRDAMDQVMIAGEQQKTSYAQQQSTALNEWYQNQVLANKQNARAAAVEQYNAETDETNSMIKDGYIQREDGSWAKDATAERATYAMTLIKQGYNEDEAWISAYAKYPSANKDENRYYAERGIGYNPNQRYDTLIVPSAGETSDPAMKLVAGLWHGRAGESKTANQVQEIGLRRAIGATGTGYSQNEWNETVELLVERARKNYQKDGLTGKELDYAVAKTVGLSLAQTWNVYASASKNPQLAKRIKSTEAIGTLMYNALGSQLAGDYLSVAVWNAGIEIG